MHLKASVKMHACKVLGFDKKRVLELNGVEENTCIKIIISVTLTHDS